MKQQVFYIHGGTAYSNYDAFLDSLRSDIPRDLPNVPKRVKWTDTLREDLGSDFEVFTPRMPNSQNAKYQEWKLWFERHFEYLEQDVILVGWSQGAYFLAKYLIEEDTLPFSVKSLFLLAAPFEPADFGGEDGGDFDFDTDDIGDLENKVSKITILHSKDDFVVPYEHALKYQAGLPKATLVTYEDKNHFLVEEFPEIIQMIRDSV
jgi:uncharacterized protein